MKKLLSKFLSTADKMRWLIVSFFVVVPLYATHAGPIDWLLSKAESNLKALLTAVLYVIMTIAGKLAMVAGLIFGVSIRYSVTEASVFLGNGGIITVGWTIVRDLRMFFSFSFSYSLVLPLFFRYRNVITKNFL